MARSEDGGAVSRSSILFLFFKKKTNIQDGIFLLTRANIYFLYDILLELIFILKCLYVTGIRRVLIHSELSWWKNFFKLNKVQDRMLEILTDGSARLVFNGDNMVICDRPKFAPLRGNGSQFT